MQKKSLDPRASVANPFVQAYVEKQAAKARPVGEAQSFVNVLLICGLVINFIVLILIGYTSSQKADKVVDPGVEGANLPLADAVLRISQLESNLAAMQSSVEFHKNAYFKLEGDYENMKAALARAQNPEARDALNPYPVVSGSNINLPLKPRAQSEAPVANNEDETPAPSNESAPLPSDTKVITQQQFASPRVSRQ